MTSTTIFLKILFLIIGLTLLIMGGVGLFIGHLNRLNRKDKQIIISIFTLGVTSLIISIFYS
jgi:hypothetical protein